MAWDSITVRSEAAHPSCRSELARELFKELASKLAPTVGEVQAACWSAAFDWHELALFDADVLGTRADDAVVGALFEHVRSPAGQA